MWQLWGRGGELQYCTGGLVTGSSKMFVNARAFCLWVPPPPLFYLPRARGGPAGRLRRRSRGPVRMCKRSLTGGGRGTMRAPPAGRVWGDRLRSVTTTGGARRPVDAGGHPTRVTISRGARANPATSFQIGDSRRRDERPALTFCARTGVQGGVPAPRGTPRRGVWPCVSPPSTPPCGSAKAGRVTPRFVARATPRSVAGGLFVPGILANPGTTPPSGGARSAARTTSPTADRGAAGRRLAPVRPAPC